MKMIRLLMVAIVLVAVGIIGYFYFDARTNLHIHKEMKVEGQPTIGNIHAGVHVVLFEEPLCSNCQEFSLHVMPAIKTTFIDAGRIAFTTIPVSFLSHSMPLAEAWLAVYHQNPKGPSSELFFKFSAYTYQNLASESEHFSLERILQMAKASQLPIDMAHLEKALKAGTYHKQMVQNTRYASEELHGHLATPALFINGISVRDISFNNIITEIHQEIARHAPKKEEHR